MTKFESPRSKEWINEQRTSDYEMECLSVGIEVSLFLAGIGTRFKIGLPAWPPAAGAEPKSDGSLVYSAALNAAQR